MTSELNNLGHGMGTELEAKDWAHISLRDLTQLQTHYVELQGHIEILWHSPRPFSSALLLTVNNATFFVKRSHQSFRSVHDLLQEHALIQYLAKHAIPVAELLFSTQQLSAVGIADWSYEVYQHAKGQDIYANQMSWKPFFYPQHASKTGQLLAQLHQVVQDFSPQQGRDARYLVSNQCLLESDDMVDAIHQRIQSSPKLRQYFAKRVLDTVLLQRIAQIHGQIQPAMQRAAKIWTHNDLHSSNLFWSDASAHAEISTVIDFGLCDRNSALYDLAVTIERNFIDWLALPFGKQIAIDWAGLQAFMQAYLADNPMLPDLDILPELLKIVHVDFALSELEYFIGISKNVKHADAAYEDWLIAHTAWFCSAQGERFTTQFSTWLREHRAQIGC